MLSHLTFKQIRQLFDPLLVHGTGDITKHESGVVIDNGLYNDINEHTINCLVSNICESVGKCRSQVSYTFRNSSTEDDSRLELTIDCHNNDKIIVIIVCTCNESSLTCTGNKVQKIALWYY